MCIYVDASTPERPDTFEARWGVVDKYDESLELHHITYVGHSARCRPTWTRLQRHPGAWDAADPHAEQWTLRKS